MLTAACGGPSLHEAGGAAAPASSRPPGPHRAAALRIWALSLLSLSIVFSGSASMPPPEAASPQAASPRQEGRKLAAAAGDWERSNSSPPLHLQPPASGPPPPQGPKPSPAVKDWKIRSSHWLHKPHTSTPSSVSAAVGAPVGRALGQVTPPRGQGDQPSRGISVFTAPNITRTTSVSIEPGDAGGAVPQRGAVLQPDAADAPQGNRSAGTGSGRQYSQADVALGQQLDSSRASGSRQYRQQDTPQPEMAAGSAYRTSRQYSVPDTQQYSQYSQAVRKNEDEEQYAPAGGRTAAYQQSAAGESVNGVDESVNSVDGDPQAGWDPYAVPPADGQQQAEFLRWQQEQRQQQQQQQWQQQQQQVQRYSDGAVASTAPAARPGAAGGRTASTAGAPRAAVPAAPTVPAAAAAAAAAPATPTILGSGGIKVVTSNPVSISNPITIDTPNTNMGLNTAWGGLGLRRKGFWG